MKTVRNTVRNLLIGYGVYIASWWVADVLVIAYGKLTQRIIYRGEFAGAVVMPFVMTFPVSRSDIVLPFISHDGLKRTNPSQQKPTTSL
jgi:hypothetical protein